MNLTERQQQALALPRKRLNVYDGAVRAGKTVASYTDWLHLLAHGPPGPALMVGKTERTLKANILDPLADWLGPRRFKLVQGAGEAFILGHRVYLVGANDERAEQKIRGRTLAKAYGDELTLWPETFFKMLLSRLSLPGACFIGTTNPDSPAHWLKRDVLDRIEELDLVRHHFRLEDNTHLDPTFVANIKAEYVGLWRKRFIEGLWVIAEGAVYDFFDPDPGAGFVVDGGLPPIVRWWVAVDYGTSNPFVALLMGTDADGVTWVADEWRWDARRMRRQRTDQEYRTELEGWLGDNPLLRHPSDPGAPPAMPERIEVDPSAASFITELRHHNLPGRGADNEVLDGIRETASRLHSHKLFIHARCTGTIDEMTAYSWDESAQKQGEDKPLKVDDHGPDALRYGVRAARYMGAATIGSGF